MLTERQSVSRSRAPAITPYLAEAHTRITPRKILPEVLGVHPAVQALLLDGGQRLRQTRELLRIDSELLAHACLLLGDLGQDQQRGEVGQRSALCAQEAEADEGIAWSVTRRVAGTALLGGH